MMGVRVRTVALILSFLTISILARLGEGSILPSSALNYLPRIVSLDDTNSNHDVETDRDFGLRTNRIGPKYSSIDGTINPVVLIPGDGGSQIEAKLDKPETVHFICEKKSDWFDIWLNIEQLIPYVIDCWVDNMRLVYDNVTRTTSDSPGVQIRVPNFGKTKGVEYLDPSEIGVSRYFTTIVETIIPFGYQRDVSVKGTPFDFRKAPNEMGEFFAKSVKLIEDTYEENSRKSCVLICHSSGCLNTLYLLNQQPQTWKDKYVKSLVSLAGPWGGAIKAMKTFASGDNVGVRIVNPLTVRLEQRTSPSLAFLMPTDKFWSRNEPIIISKLKNYTLANLREFFGDINWPTGYQMWLDVQPIVEGLKPPGVEVHCLYGIGVATMEKAIYETDDFPNEIPTLVNGEGDGTVNLISLEGCSRWRTSQSQAVHSRSFNGTDHMAILHDPRVLDYIKRLVNVSEA